MVAAVTTGEKWSAASYILARVRFESRQQRAYSPLSVAFEHPKSSLLCAQPASLNTGNVIVATIIALGMYRFISTPLFFIWPDTGALFSTRRRGNARTAGQAIKG